MKTENYVSALPGGNGNSDGSFSNVGDLGSWWKSRRTAQLFDLMFKSIIKDASSSAVMLAYPSLKAWLPQFTIFNILK